MEGLGCVFISSKYRVTKGFKFHARPQTGAYSCYIFQWSLYKELQFYTRMSSIITEKYCRGDWPKMDHYDNTDHPLYLGPWWAEEIMGNRGYLWDVFKHSTEVSEPKSHFSGHEAKLFGKKLQRIIF